MPESGSPRRALLDTNRPSFWIALLVGVPVSALLLWLAFRNVDVDAMWDVVRGADLPLLVVAVVVVGLVYVLQGLRWRTIVGRPKPTRRRYTELIAAGIACNNVLPGRVGELYRSRVIALEAGLPSGRGFATVILDRCFDVAALATFLLVALPMVVGEAWLLRIAVGAAVLLVVIAAGLLFARRYTHGRSRQRRRRGLVRGLVRDTLEGLAEPLGRRRIAQSFGLSLGAWAVWATAAVLVGRSVGVDLHLLDALFVTAVLGLGTAIPSSPGYVGTYQWLGVEALTALGVPREEALAFSIVMHATWYVPTTLAGAYVLLARTDWEAFGRRTQRGVAG